MHPATAPMPPARLATKADAGDWATLQKDLENLQTVDGDLAPAKSGIRAERGARLSK